MIYNKFTLLFTFLFLLAPSIGSATPVTMDVMGTDAGGNIVSASITIDYDDIDGDADDPDLKVSIENTSGDNSVITAWGLETPGENPIMFDDPAIVTGTLDDSDWSFVSPIAGNGMTTNGVGPFGEFDFGMTTGNELNSGSSNSGIAVGGTGMFTFNDFDAGVLIGGPAEFFLSDNGDGLSMGLRFQQTGPSGDERGAKIGKLVPEPSSGFLLAFGLPLLVLVRLRRRSRRT